MTNETKKWSDGPWTIGNADRQADSAKLYVRCARRIEGAPAGIAVAHVLAAPGRAEQIANASLIGAVLDLHGALAELVELLPSVNVLSVDWGAVLARSRAALAKAEGR